MKILVLNGSPRKTGTVATLLKLVVESVTKQAEVEWIDVIDLSFKPCRGCMKCRESGQCILPSDDAHKIGEKLKQADALIIGTPVNWGDMNGYLKMLFDRNVPVLMGESKLGIPIPLQKGKKAIIVTACTTPWPFNYLADQTRGAVSALREILGYSGYKIMGKVIKAGTKSKPALSKGIIRKARLYGKKLSSF